MFKKALEKSPDNLLALVPLTGAYVLAGRLEEAKATAKEVLRVNPRFSVDRYVRISPFKDESDKIKNTEALRKAGAEMNRGRSLYTVVHRIAFYQSLHPVRSTDLDIPHYSSSSKDSRLTYCND